MTLQELREKRAKLATEIRRIADLVNNEGRDFTAEEQANWAKLNTDYDANKRALDIAERAEAVRAEAEASPSHRDVGREDLDGRRDPHPESEPDLNGRDRDAIPAEEARALAIQAWFRSGLGRDLSPRHERACRQVGFRPGYGKSTCSCAIQGAFVNWLGLPATLTRAD